MRMPSLRSKADGLQKQNQTFLALTVTVSTNTLLPIFEASTNIFPPVLFL
jgi:hypothetical protein